MGFVGEVETERRPHFFLFARGLEVHVKHQLIAWIQAPRKPRGLDMRRATGFPKQEIAVGIERAAANYQVHAGKAFARRGLVKVRRSRAVDQQIGVMHHARLAGANLDGAHPAARGQVGSEDDVPIDIAPRSRQVDRGRRFQHQIGLAELPTVREGGCRRGLSDRPFGSAGANPGGNGRDLFRG